MIRKTISWLCLTVLATSVLGQSDDIQLSEADFFDDAPLILTVSRMSKPLEESPASVSVIDREMIEASGARDIADLFKMVPGFVVGYHKGHVPVVTYNGMGQIYARQMQVLIDGRSVFIPSFGGIPWTNLPLLIDDIERIEIIRGPNAVTYGANAFLATINIITRHASEDFGARYSVTASDNSNPDIKDAYLKFGHRFNDVDWRVSLGSVSDQGFSDLNDSRDVAKINFRLDYATESDQLWTVHFGSSNTITGQGFERITNQERDDEATNSYLNLQWESPAEGSNSIARLTHTRHRVVDNFETGQFDLQELFGDSAPPGIGANALVDFDRTSERTDIEFIRNQDLSKTVRAAFGASLRKDRVKSNFLFSDDDYREADTQRLFGSMEWQFSNAWTVDGGVMFEDSSLTDRENSVRLSLIRKIGNDHALRLVGATAKRNPILWEYEGLTVFPIDLDIGGAPIGTLNFPTWQSSGDLQPEEIESFEIGLRSQFPNQGITSDIKIFKYDISNHIFEDEEVEVDLVIPGLGTTTVDVVDPVNSQKTDVQGIELEIKFNVNKNLNLHTGASYLKANSTNRFYERSFPESSGFLTAHYRINSFHEISASYYYTGNISWVDSKNIIDSVNRFDIRYAWYMDNLRINRLEFIAQNLIEDYEDYEIENVHDQIFYLRFTGGF